MIKGCGTIRKLSGIVHDRELLEVIGKLPDNQGYDFLIADQNKNRALPYTTYLFTVLLKSISDQLPDHPDKEALYRYFEEMFAPPHIGIINGKQYTYYNLKKERNKEIISFCERVADYVFENWGIEVPSMESLKEAENRDLFEPAYLQQEIDWNNFISRRKHKQQP